MKRWLLAPAALGCVALAGCPHHGMPVGPPPEYERPALPAWEAATPPPPAEQEGEPVTDDETPTDAGPADATPPVEAQPGGGGDAGPAR